jgi:hypothetical protein
MNSACHAIAQTYNEQSAGLSGCEEVTLNGGPEMTNIEHTSNNMTDAVVKKAESDNHAKLRRLMEKYDISVVDVAKIMERSKWTVHHWLDSTGHSRPIPNETLQLLEMKLQLKAAKKRAG